MSHTIRKILYSVLAVMCVLCFFGSAEAFAANEDVIEYYRVDTGQSVIEFDTSEGPYYRINYEQKKILDCSSEGSRIRKCTVDGNILTLVLYSEERPKYSTYKFDLSVPEYQYQEEDMDGDDVPEKDRVEYYKVYPSINEIEFDTIHGPLYRINYAEKQILSCTSDGAKIKKCTLKGNKLKLTVYSSEYPRNYTYTFDLSKNIEKINRDKISYYRVYFADSVIEFDTDQGPYYKIDYKKKKILACTSDHAVLKKCTVKGNNLKLKVGSDEFSGDVTYSFVLTKNVVMPGTLSIQQEPQSFVGMDNLVYGIVNGEAIVVEVNQKNARKLTIPATIQFGSRFPVTGIYKNTFKGMKNLTSVVIGKNVTAIGKQAFRSCKELKRITIKTKKLTSNTVKANSFMGIRIDAVVTCPAGMAEAYQKILLKRGMENTVRFK